MSPRTGQLTRGARLSPRADSLPLQAALLAAGSWGEAWSAQRADTGGAWDPVGQRGRSAARPALSSRRVQAPGGPTQKAAEARPCSPRAEAGETREVQPGPDWGTWTGPRFPRAQGPAASIAQSAVTCVKVQLLSSLQRGFPAIHGPRQGSRVADLHVQNGPKTWRFYKTQQVKKRSLRFSVIEPT